MHGYFLSDLHLFSKRSQGEAYVRQIRETADRAHTLVLGGDIFDFKWSTRPTLRHSIDEAIRWVYDLIESHPNCAFYYLLGNHDAHPDFVAELDRLAFEQPRLVWQPYVLRLGRCVFLHGDVLDGDSRHEMIDVRRRVHQDQPVPYPYRHWLYDAVVMARLHRVAVHVVKRQVTATKENCCPGRGNACFRFKQEAGVGQWVDAMMRLEGPAVEALAITFQADWFVETNSTALELPDVTGEQLIEKLGDAVIQVLPSGRANQVEAIDGKISLFGSLNMDPRSFRLNFEITLAVYDEPFTKQLRTLQQNYLEQSTFVDLDLWAKRAPLTRFGEKAARLLGPLL